MEQATFALVAAGVIGLLIATPLLAVVIVLVKMLYRKDALGQKVSLSGQKATREAS
jgi:predicted PurR-regulated permease PerM